MKEHRIDRDIDNNSYPSDLNVKCIFVCHLEAKLYQEFERLQAIMNDLKKENYDLKLRLQESGNLVDMVSFLLVRIGPSALKSTDSIG